jgi:hypothetical protein
MVTFIVSCGRRSQVEIEKKKSFWLQLLTTAALLVLGGFFLYFGQCWWIEPFAMRENLTQVVLKVHDVLRPKHQRMFRVVVFPFRFKTFSPFRFVSIQ